MFPKKLKSKNPRSKGKQMHGPNYFPNQEQEQGRRAINYIKKSKRKLEEDNI